MRVGISWLLGTILLFGQTSTAAPTFPCTSVAPEVRDQVRAAGACRDDTAAAAAPKRKRAAPRKSAAPAKLEAPEATAPSASPAGTADTEPVTAPAAVAASSTPPVADAAPAPSATSAPASEPIVRPERARSTIAFKADAALLIAAGLSLGLVFGARLIRRQRLRRVPTADASAAPPTPSDAPPVAADASAIAETGAAPRAIRFTARRAAGETTIVLAPRPNGDEVAIEYSSPHA